jgi:NUMOD4 motif
MKKIPGEKWELIKGARGAQGQKYGVSNHGRVASFMGSFPKEGFLLKPSLTGGYPILSFRIKGKQKTHMVHRVVAETFCKRPSVTHRFVVHLNFKKADNYYKNLKWCTRKEQAVHDSKNPTVKRAKRERSKLNEAQVRKIKIELANPKKITSLKTLAYKHGVTDMQIHRIKTGENWSHVKI